MRSFSSCCDQKVARLVVMAGTRKDIGSENGGECQTVHKRKTIPKII